MLIIQLTVCHLKTFKQITQTENFTMFKAALTQRRRNLKTPALRFSVDGKYFENGVF